MKWRGPQACDWLERELDRRKPCMQQLQEPRS